MIDYFESPEGAAPPAELFCSEKPLYVLASHRHRDHFSPAVLTWQEKKDDIIYVFSSDIANRPKGCIVLSPGEVYEDGALRISAFGSTDEGVSFALECGGSKVFHAGDLNDWHWTGESTEEEMAAMQQAFEEILANIAAKYPAFDLACFPVDPRMEGDYARGAKEFLARVRCRVFVPMHFWGNFSAAAAFAPAALAAKARFFCPQAPGDCLTLDE